ncbi:nucleoside hydrolase [Microbacterium sp. SORGH_AS_0888]|uniref:nucleoside hydrolase n=1 Tax=Microbacterium sp. SORGH_AS_0888 TaxID=3041791 RepID=UPI0027899AA4|nr:nucleoside hydrolase [Microbacterium sp. SORGH_AS_0888]MDQ1130994.1 inosine-uridine nucleoside N-ribohydrolase [Microbacterium sp. SORGH_AS_0888]
MPDRQRIILDTDIGYLNDDSIALAVLLGSEDVDLLGVAVVAGNFDHDQEVVDGLSMLERLGRTEVPLWRGAVQPLVHERGPYEERGWGRFATFPELDYPLGRPPAIDAAPLRAAAALQVAAREHPGEVTVLAIGPLTNLAIAFALDPELPALLRRVVIMGGSAVSFAGGAGNVTPTAEFNFWVDPEAAAAVLRAPVEKLLVPLNATRQVGYTADFHRAATSGDGGSARMLRERMAGFFDEGTDDRSVANFSHYGLTDSTAVIAALRPELFDIRRMTVQIDLSHGPAYGTSYLYRPGDLDEAKVANADGVWDAFVQPHRLVGGVSSPFEVDVALFCDADAVRAECLTRLAGV